MSIRKVLVTGSRTFSDAAVIFRALDAQLDDVETVVVIHGRATGADDIAGQWARAHDMPECRFPARWSRYRSSAGPIRNRMMFDVMQPDVVLAFPMKGSKGTIDMIDYARSQGCEVLVHEPE